MKSCESQKNKNSTQVLFKTQKWTRNKHILREAWRLIEDKCGLSNDVGGQKKKETFHVVTNWLIMC